MTDCFFYCQFPSIWIFKPNIIKAIKTAKQLGAYVVTLSGKKEDNESRKLGDINFYVPLKTYGMVESAFWISVK